MRGAGLIAAGLMSVWMLVGCGGTLEESPADTSVGAEVEALYACPLGGSCPPGTECVNGLCRNCAITPQFCGLVGPAQSGAAVEAQAIERIAPGGPAEVR